MARKSKIPLEQQKVIFEKMQAGDRQAVAREAAVEWDCTPRNILNLMKKFKGSGVKEIPGEAASKDETKPALAEKTPAVENQEPSPVEAEGPLAAQPETAAGDLPEEPSKPVACADDVAHAVLDETGPDQQQTLSEQAAENREDTADSSSAPAEANNAEDELETEQPADRSNRGYVLVMQCPTGDELRLPFRNVYEATQRMRDLARTAVDEAEEPVWLSLQRTDDLSAEVEGFI